MPISTQMRLIRAMRDILSGEGGQILAEGTNPKPVYELARPPAALPRSTPEAQGLDSAYLEKLYRDIAAEQDAGAHTLLVARNGHVVSEGYFAPFRKDVWHVTHSLCKTFTGTAIGLCAAKGLLKLDDPVAQYFDEYINLLTPLRMRQVTIRHLLTMSSGINYNEISEVVDSEWLKGIFSSSLAFKPGTRFMYNSMNSYLLSALVQRVSGKPMGEFLEEHIFTPMGFGPVAFEKSPEGIEKGGWGMYITPEDMLKFGQLWLQKGRWLVDGEERQLIPKGWIDKATQPHMLGEKGEVYGYHLWIDSADGTYIMNGMFGQYITVIPKLNLVLAMTSGNAYVFTDSPAHELIRERLYSINSLPGSLPDNPAALASLRATLSGLEFRRPAAPQVSLKRQKPFPSRAARWQRIQWETGGISPAIRAFCGTTWQFPKNRAGFLPVVLQVIDNNFSTGIAALRLEEQGNGSLLMLWEEQEGTVVLPVGISKAEERHIHIGHEQFLAAGRCDLRQNEDGEDVLVIEVALLEHSSCRIIKLTRKGENLLLRMDEAPQLPVAIETVMLQAANTGEAEQGRPGAAEQLLSSDLVEYKIEQLCHPQVLGKPFAGEEHIV